MKLLFDENLSHKLPALLSVHFPDSTHVRDCGLKGATDEAIRQYAATNGFTIVSKDSDFNQVILLHGHPPKLIWLRLGNCTREDVIALLVKHKADVLTFDANATESVLVLS